MTGVMYNGLIKGWQEKSGKGPPFTLSLAAGFSNARFLHVYTPQKAKSSYKEAIPVDILEL